MQTAEFLAEKKQNEVPDRRVSKSGTCKARSQARIRRLLTCRVAKKRRLERLEPQARNPRGDWTFVTRNSCDFRGPETAPGSKGQYAGVEIHAGLICLNGPEGMDLDLQLELFEVALNEIAEEDDLINQVIEVTASDDDDISFLRYALPPRQSAVHRVKRTGDEQSSIKTALRSRSRLGPRKNSHFSFRPAAENVQALAMPCTFCLVTTEMLPDNAIPVSGTRMLRSVAGLAKSDSGLPGHALRQSPCEGVPYGGI